MPVARALPAAPRRPAAFSAAASRKSVSSAKCRCASRLARKRTSSASTSVVDARRLVEHRRHHDQRARLRRDARARSPCAAARAARTSSVREPVHQRHRELARARAAAATREQPRAAHRRRRRGARVRQRAPPRQQRSTSSDRAEVGGSGERRRDARATRRAADARASRAALLEARPARRRPGSSRRAPARSSSPLRPWRRGALRQLRSPRRATSLSRRALRLRDPLDDVAVAVARREVHRGRRRRPDPRAASARRRSSSRRTRASPSRRGSAGCRCCCRSRPGRRPAAGSRPAPAARSVWPASASRCSIQVSGSASAALWPCSRRASSATNALRHRRVRARHVGDHEDEAPRVAARRPAVIWSAQRAGAARGRRALRRCARATRRRFSISARRSMIGIAHSSPSVQRRDRLVGGDEARRLSASTRPSPCEIASSAMS